MKYLVTAYIVIAFVLYGEAYHHYEKDCVEKEYSYCEAGMKAFLSAYAWPMYLSYRLWQ